MSAPVCANCGKSVEGTELCECCDEPTDQEQVLSEMWTLAGKRANNAEKRILELEAENARIRQVAVKMRNLAWRTMDSVKLYGRREDYDLLRAIVDDKELKELAADKSGTGRTG